MTAMPNACGENGLINSLAFDFRWTGCLEAAARRFRREKHGTSFLADRRPSITAANRPLAFKEKKFEQICRPMECHAWERILEASCSLAVKDGSQAGTCVKGQGLW